MADNYLERQYENYAARKAAWEKAKKLGKKHLSMSDVRKIEEEKEKQYESDIADNEEEQ